MVENLQNEAGRAGYGNGYDHRRRGRSQFKSDPGMRLSQQPTAKRAKGKTSQEHQDDRDRLFNDKHTLGQELMNGFQKVEKKIADPSTDLDLPKRPQIQEIPSIHELHFISRRAAAFCGLAHKSFSSSHFQIVQPIRSS